MLPRIVEVVKELLEKDEIENINKRPNGPPYDDGGGDGGGGPGGPGKNNPNDK